MNLGSVAAFHLESNLRRCDGRLRRWSPEILSMRAAALLAASSWLVLSPMLSRAEDNTWLYAVQISAQVQVSPPQIALRWGADQNATKYTIYRKSEAATQWGLPLAELGGAATNYTDANVQVGRGYEYQIVKKTSLGYTGYGYIYSAIELPMTEDRGKLVLVVETNATASLTGELARLRQDLVGDGWTVIPIGVSSNDAPAAVRALIIDQYRADPANVDAVFLFGHVPILESGDIN